MSPIGSPHAACVDRLNVESWLVDLTSGTVDVFTQPSAHGYQPSFRARRDDRIISSALPSASLFSRDILGDLA